MSITVVVPTVDVVDVGMLMATLPGWLQTAMYALEVVIVNGSNKSSIEIEDGLYWLKKGTFKVIDEECSGSVISAMRQGLEKASGKIVVFLHDDVFIHERAWDSIIEQQFLTYETGVVGFGGCSRLEGQNGIINCAGTYYSNWDDAEFFGKRIKEKKEVAHLDGHCLAIRRNWLDEEWIDNKDAAVYDAWFSCIAKERSQKCIVVPVRSYHTSWLQGNGQHEKELKVVDNKREVPRHGNIDYGQSRKWLFYRYKNILPIEVTDLDENK
jgi:hypothetical protein